MSLAVICSCSDFLEDQNPKFDSRENLKTKSSEFQSLLADEIQNCIDSDYICLNEDHFELVLSRAEMVEMGFSEDCYNILAAELEKANVILSQTIEDCANDPNITSHEIYYNKDFMEGRLEDGMMIPAIKYRNEIEQIMPSDVLYSSLGVPGHAQEWAMVICL